MNYKNYIEDLSKVKDKNRWMTDKEDILHLSDGTQIVVSNQWGFHNTSKPKMDRLIKFAQKYGIDTSLPQ